MKPLRRWRVWLLALAVIASVAGLCVRSSSDNEFAFLDDLHPQRVHEDNPYQYVLRFPRETSPQVRQRLTTVLLDRGYHTLPGNADLFMHPNGYVVDYIGSANGASLLVHHNPTWFQRQMDVVKGWLHMGPPEYKT